MSEQDTPADMPTKAIAIKGEDTEGSVPTITAKGEGELAERILDIAFAEGVKVRQDKDLTELLDAFDVESPVPLEALHTVTLILERVYAENRKLSEAGPQTNSDNKQENGEAVNHNERDSEDTPGKE